MNKTKLHANLFAISNDARNVLFCECGEKVADIPADLPKVTLAKDGKPSIDMNGYKGSD